MKRAYLTIRLVLEDLIGVVVLFEFGRFIIASPARITSIAVLVGVPLGIGLVFDAFRVRRMLNQLDAKNDPPQD